MSVDQFKYAISLSGIMMLSRSLVNYLNLKKWISKLNWIATPTRPDSTFDPNQFNIFYNKTTGNNLLK